MGLLKLSFKKTVSVVNEYLTCYLILKFPLIFHEKNRVARSRFTHAAVRQHERSRSRSSEAAQAFEVYATVRQHEHFKVYFRTLKVHGREECNPNPGQFGGSGVPPPP